MQTEFGTAVQGRIRRVIADRLCSVGDVAVRLVAERPWASITFEGLRLTFDIVSPMPCRAVRGHVQSALGCLSEAEFPVTGGFVADVGCQPIENPHDGCLARIDVLVVSDAGAP
jgi:hypothetical protein